MKAKIVRNVVLVVVMAASLALSAQAADKKPNILVIWGDDIGIATPVKTHHPIARDFLSLGKHVFVEKPLAHSHETALELAKLAEEKERVLMVGHTFEYTAAVNKVKEISASGELGKILYISCTRVNLGLFQPDINVVWDLAPHDISIILYLMGEVPVSVNSQGKAHFNHEIEDVATTTLNFKNGLIAFIHNSWLDPNKIRLTNIVGSKKMLVYDDLSPNENITIYDKGVEVPPHYDTFADFQFEQWVQSLALKVAKGEFSEESAVQLIKNQYAVR